MQPTDAPKCELCGEPMPPGEEMFKFHGYSGPCPKPPLDKARPLDTMVMCIEDGDLSFMDAPPKYVAELKRRTQKSKEFFLRARAAEAERDQLRKQMSLTREWLNAWEAGLFTADQCLLKLRSKLSLSQQEDIGGDTNE